MRFGWLDLRRFGRFTDRRIELSAKVPDLQLIVGPNEAGKSTLRAALADLLFGIEARSPFDFLHNYKDMCVAAMIERDGERLTFQRLKRNRDSLRDLDDRPLPDERLAVFLGPVDRAFFERMFALDRHRLEEGGVEILKAKNDLGRMLFEASAGLAHLGELRKELEAEADTLWGPRKKQSRLYSVALDAYEAARKDLHESTVRAQHWQDARKSADAADAALQAAKDRYLALETTRARLERIRRVANHFRQREQLLAGRTALGDVVLLPLDAAARVDAAAQTIAAQATIIAQQQSLIDKAEKEAAAVVVDQSVLRRREEVERLRELRSQVSSHPEDITKRQAEVQLLQSSAADLARQLGWQTDDEAEIARRIPSAVVRAGIKEQLLRFARITEAAQLSAEMAAAAERDRAINDQELARLADRAVPSALLAARQDARALGDIAGRRRELVEAVDAARRRLAAAMGELAPWAGDLEALLELHLPDTETVLAHARQEQETAESLRSLQARMRETANALDEARLTAEQIARDRRPPTANEIATARTDRDATWTEIRDGRIAAATAAETYEAKVVHADDLADRRYLAAADVEKLEQTRNQIEQLELRHRRHVAEMETLEAERSRLARVWAALVPDRLSQVAAAAFTGWLQRRQRAIEEADRLDEADTALARFDAAVAKAADGLCKALTDVGAAAASGVRGTLAEVLADVDAFVASIETAAARRSELTKQRAKLDVELIAKMAKAEAAAAELAECTQRLANLRAAAHLPADLGCDATEAALDLQVKLRQTLDQIDDIRNARIATMQRDLDAFASSARDLAATLAPDLTERDAAAVALALNHRLVEAEKARDRQQRAIADRAEAMKAKAEAEGAQQRAEATLRPLAECAGTDSTDALRAAVARSDEARRIDAALAEETRLILDGGDGLSLVELEKDVAAEDLATMGARLSEIEVQRESARDAREQALLAKKAADDALAAINGSAAAAEAEARRQEALADMASAAERYITVFVAAKLLGWAVDRFRAEKQDPLLRRAGEIFHGLTLGSFAALSVDYDGDTPHLMGRRDTGAHVGVDGMSEGTRDQLYLALRLAAIEQHIDKGRPLPFIADDLFVNFDDARAAAGFRALADLARRTQVIFLSHHAHLVDVARHALGDGLMVSEL